MRSYEKRRVGKVVKREEMKVGEGRRGSYIGKDEIRKAGKQKRAE